MEPTREDLLKAAEKLKAAVNVLVQHATADHVADGPHRQAVIAAAKQVITCVRNPFEELMDMSGQVSRMVATRLFYEWNAFDSMPTQGWISYQKLAAATDTEESLLRRVGGVLVATGLLRQSGTDDIAHTANSLAYRRDNRLSAAFVVLWNNAFAPGAKYPEYFRQYGRKEPQTINHIPISYARGCPELGYYEMIAQDPAYMVAFQTSMAFIEANVATSGIYDFSWLVDEVKRNPESNRAVLVDVGGGKGQSIIAIHTEFPGLPLQRCVLEELPEVINEGLALKEPRLAEIQRVPVNFHEDQPIKGAYTYWVRRCFHNYGDEICVNMLRILVDAMADDSKILIQEDVLPNPPGPLEAFLDFQMIGQGGKVRNIDCWNKVLGRVGLRISSVSRGKVEGQTLSVIECVKAD